MKRIKTQGGQFLVEYKVGCIELLFDEYDLCIIANTAYALAGERFHLREIEGLIAPGEFFIAKFPFAGQSQPCGCPPTQRLVKSLCLLSLLDLNGEYCYGQFVLWRVLKQKSLLYRRYIIIIPKEQD